MPRSVVIECIVFDLALLGDHPILELPVRKASVSILKIYILNV